MNRSSSSAVRVLTLAVILVAVVACQDKRVRAVDTGISKDSALAILSQGAQTKNTDSLTNIYRRERYLINGKNYDVLYFHGDSAKLGNQTRDTIPWKKLTPIVTIDNKVVGKGWDYWDSLSKANNIPTKPR